MLTELCIKGWPGDSEKEVECPSNTCCKTHTFVDFCQTVEEVRVGQLCRGVSYQSRDVEAACSQMSTPKRNTNSAYSSMTCSGYSSG